MSETPRSGRSDCKYGREELERSLTANGISYRWMKDLGGRRRSRPDSPHTGWRVEGFRAYADYMDSLAFATALDELIQLARKAPTVQGPPSGCGGSAIVGSSLMC